MLTCLKTTQHAAICLLRDTSLEEYEAGSECSSACFESYLHMLSARPFATSTAAVGMPACSISLSLSHGNGGISSSWSYKQIHIQTLFELAEFVSMVTARQPCKWLVHNLMSSDAVSFVHFASNVISACSSTKALPYA